MRREPRIGRRSGESLRQRHGRGRGRRRRRAAVVFLEWGARYLQGMPRAIPLFGTCLGPNS
eukprot:9486939-Pyramimonas_sp.AAC.1